MWQYIVKIVITAVAVVAVTEIAKRSSFWAAALASLPVTSLLAFAWIYTETGDTQRIATLSHSIFWLILPTLPLFLLLPLLLRLGVDFWISLGLACATTAVAYALMLRALATVGVEL
jgi:hypothetical protein